MVFSISSSIFNTNINIKKPISRKSKENAYVCGETLGKCADRFFESYVLTTNLIGIRDHVGKPEEYWRPYEQCLHSSTCSLSLWRVAQGSKQMFLELTHGLFIT